MKPFDLTKITFVPAVAAMILSFADGYAQGPPASDGLPINVAKNINAEVQGERLDHFVNSPFRELGPMPTKDGRRLYFSRQGHPDNTGGPGDEDIWYCEFDDVTQDWGQDTNMGAPLNNDGPNFVTGVGIAGDTLLLANEYRKKGKMKAGVSVSIRVGELWSFPVPVKIAADYNVAGRVSYDLSSDRNTLIIAQQKVDTYGKLDLYVAFRDPNQPNSYAGTESINLGPVINTFGDETSPWLAYDGHTLYFASNGHNGYGNLDIFVSRRLDNTWTNWSEPENLGSGVNSRYDDLSFNYNPRNRFAYYVRGFSSENTDIMKVDMTNLFLQSDMRPAEIGETRSVTNVFSDNESEINSNALTDLQSIAAYLKKNSAMIIQVSTHSNLHDSRNESLKLSNERAIRIVDFLVANGIANDRLTYQGMGHDVVATSHATGKSFKVSPATVEFKVISY